RAIAALTPALSVAATSSIVCPSNGAVTVIVDGDCWTVCAAVVMGQRYPRPRSTNRRSLVELVEPRTEPHNRPVACREQRVRHVTLVAPDFDVFDPSRARILVGALDDTLGGFGAEEVQRFDGEHPRVSRKPRMGGDGVDGARHDRTREAGPLGERIECVLAAIAGGEWLHV